MMTTEEIRLRNASKALDLVAAGYKVIPPENQLLEDVLRDAEEAAAVMQLAEVLDKLRQHTGVTTMAPSHLYKRLGEEYAKLGEELIARAPEESIKSALAAVLHLGVGMLLSLRRGTPLASRQITVP